MPGRSLESARASARAVVLGLLLGIGLPASVARAELKEVTQIAAGMECAECSRNLRVAIKALDGVEDAETSWNRRILKVKFRAGSRATLDDVREIVRLHHFEAREAEIVAVGRLERSAGGDLTLRISGSDAVYLLKGAVPSVVPAGAAVEVKGRVAGQGPSSPTPELWVLALRGA